ncbi:OmcA/MtrC family decaheme c-type cytochrome [Shewanella sp. DNRA4]|uniref:OmcA/MtrC family decaheme c-type cytochrome n=1 Tax=Shewanella sp. DNRA4 TaxID=2723055 RepID=UPI00146C4C66|nr:OmcA/MtrC family decaheme c-type cytochrome [Shewanella sp. DNRA4]NMD50240.1 OmcA/MtrC family decaheme c-type cytochrome [Shewanella sp. DNRA4]
MMKRFNFNTATKAMLGAGLLSLLLTGCGGSDGKDGEDGKPGVVGVNITSTSTLKAKFTNATVDAGKVTVDFTLENANGVAVLGLTKDHDLRFGIAQLTPVKEKVGETEANRGYQWQAYINAKKEPGTIPSGVDNLKPSAQYQANVEAASKCDTCLVDHGDGSYSYTYQANIANVTEPLTVTYSADATQRATMELELPQLTANAHFDWQPSTGKTEGIQTRNVVSIQACYTCHQPESLELHGGRRIDIENCASCHTATSGDPESGNSIEFTYMIHAIHKGGERHTFDETGAEVPAPYKIVGYGGKVIDYGKVGFPLKPAADCSACHVEGAGAPANADLFKADLSNQACIGCHTEKPSAHHSSTDCTSCHNATEPYGGTGSAAKRHGDVLKAFKDTEAMSVKFSDITADSSGTLTAKMQVLDSTGTAIDKSYVDQGTSIMVSWDSDKDFTGYKSVKLSSPTDVVFDATSKTYALTIKGLTPPATSQTIQLYSDLTACFNNGGYNVADVVMTACSEPNVRKVHIKQAPLNVVWNATGIDNNATPKARRNIIDAGKCQGCHGDVIYTSTRGDHHANGVNCGVCHTPTKSLNKDDKYPGGKIPSSFAWKAHEREGHYLKYAGVQSGTVLKTDCATCHTVDKSNVVTGIALGRSPERVWRYGDITNNGADIWISSDAGACLSCHQKYLSDAAKSHIETNGGILNGSSAADVQTRASESCATCHTPSQLMEAHGN